MPKPYNVLKLRQQSRDNFLSYIESTRASGMSSQSICESLLSAWRTQGGYYERNLTKQIRRPIVSALVDATMQRSSRTFPEPISHSFVLVEKAGSLGSATVHNLSSALPFTSAVTLWDCKISWTGPTSIRLQQTLSVYPDRKPRPIRSSHSMEVNLARTTRSATINSLETSIQELLTLSNAGLTKYLRRVLSVQNGECVTTGPTPLWIEVGMLRILQAFATIPYRLLRLLRLFRLPSRRSGTG